MSRSALAQGTRPSAGTCRRRVLHLVARPWLRCPPGSGQAVGPGSAGAWLRVILAEGGRWPPGVDHCAPSSHVGRRIMIDRQRRGGRAGRRCPGAEHTQRDHRSATPCRLGTVLVPMATGAPLVATPEQDLADLSAYPLPASARLVSIATGEASTLRVFSRRGRGGCLSCNMLRRPP